MNLSPDQLLKEGNLLWYMYGMLQVYLKVINLNLFLDPNLKEGNLLK